MSFHGIEGNELQTCSSYIRYFDLVQSQNIVSLTFLDDSAYFLFA